jgi:short-subunit dehydrogenase
MNDAHLPTPAGVLVTGASSGIGEALARCFARDGHRLVLVARQAEKLEALAGTLRTEHGTRSVVLPTDLAEPGAVAALGRTLRKRRITVDVLVNNAGILAQGRFDGIAAAEHRQLIDLNIGALTELIAELVPPMVRRGRGRVLNVASVAAFQPIPGLACYAASKAYVLSLTEALSEELRGSGVSVTALCPGITATAMLDNAASANSKVAALPPMLIGEVDAVAEAGYRACLAGEVIVVPGALNRAATMASGATPKWLLRRVTGMIGRRLL